MPDDVQADAWVERVLGVNVQRVLVPGTKLLPVWVEAKDRADEALLALQQALRSAGRRRLRLIADQGIAGMTDGESVAMMVALRNYDAAPQAGRVRLSAAAAKFRSFLDTSPAVALVGRNPFGVAIDLRSIFGRALDTIDQSVAG